MIAENHSHHGHNVGDDTITGEPSLIPAIPHPSQADGQRNVAKGKEAHQVGAGRFSHPFPHQEGDKMGIEGDGHQETKG